MEHQIERVICRDRVKFEIKQYNENKLVEYRRGGASQFSLNRQTGTTEA